MGTITPGSRTFYQYGVKVASAESELLPLKVVLRFRCFPTTFTGKKFANRVHRAPKELGGVRHKVLLVRKGRKAAEYS